MGELRVAGCFRVFPALLLVTLIAASSPAAGFTIVVCAPGYPGSTAEAQSAMEGFAAAAAAAAGWDREDLAAEYFETEEGGVTRLAAADAGFALVTLPFFLEYRERLGLEAEMLAVPTGRRAAEPWFLAAGKDKVHGPEGLDGWQLVSLAGHSERFVRGPALGGWGDLPSNLSITFSGAVLSSLRKAARGEKIVVLLDAEQAEAVDRLPFAGDLEIVHTSPPLPVSVVCSIGDRVGSEKKSELLRALGGLAVRPDAAEALAGVRLERFEPADTEALKRAEAAFSGVAE